MGGAERRGPAGGGRQKGGARGVRQTVSQGRDRWEESERTTESEVFGGENHNPLNYCPPLSLSVHVAHLIRRKIRSLLFSVALFVCVCVCGPVFPGGCRLL